MIGNNFNLKKPGYSLVEVIVSVTLFSVIILTATSIFKMVVDSQRSALAAQNVQESLKYFLEVTGKEMRMAQKNNGICPGIDNDKVFKVATDVNGGDVLSFKNYYGECVAYYLSPDTTDSSIQRFTIDRHKGAVGGFDYISPRKINIDSLHFIVNESTSTQPVVTLNLTAHAWDQQKFDTKMTIQTSITSRYYK